MIINRDQLAMQCVVGDDGTLQVNGDGSAVATNKKVLLICEGVPEEIRNRVPLQAGELGDERVAVTPETAREMLKNVPRDRKFGGLLEHLDVTATVTDVTFTSTDGKRRTRKTAKRSDREVNAVPGAQLIRRTLRSGTALRMCLNLSRLVDLLTAMNTMSDDTTGESPVWIAVSPEGDIALRTVKWKTGQRILGYMHGYSEEGAQAPEDSEWERGIDVSSSAPHSIININGGTAPTIRRRRREPQG